MSKADTHRIAVCGPLWIHFKGGSQEGTGWGRPMGCGPAFRPSWGAMEKEGCWWGTSLLAYTCHGNPRKRGECQIRDRFIRNREKSRTLIFVHFGKICVMLSQCRSLPPQTIRIPKGKNKWPSNGTLFFIQNEKSNKHPYQKLLIILSEISQTHKD